MYLAANPARRPIAHCSTPATLFQAAGPWLVKGLIGNLSSTTQNPAFDAQDMETAAAQTVADAHGVPFLGVRGISDGQGDPLHLPGFPVSFFYYKQLAAGNAASGDGGLPAELAGHLTALFGPAPNGAVRIRTPLRP